MTLRKFFKKSGKGKGENKNITPTATENVKKNDPVSEASVEEAVKSGLSVFLQFVINNKCKLPNIKDIQVKVFPHEYETLEKNFESRDELKAQLDLHFYKNENYLCFEFAANDVYLGNDEVLLVSDCDNTEMMDDLLQMMKEANSCCV